MLRINALLFLFIIQFLLIFMGFTAVQSRKLKKLNIKLTISLGEIRRLESEIDTYKEEVTGLQKWEPMFNELQMKFEKVNSTNSKLKAMIDVLIPEAERSKEFQEIINEVESDNKELSVSIGTLKNDNEALIRQIKSFENEVSGLSKQLSDSVKKEEYQRVITENNRLELKVEHLKDDLDKKTKDYEKLEKNYMYLEKEYNALYNNLKGEVT